MKWEKLNTLQVPTWRHSRLNDTTLETDTPAVLPYRQNPVVSAPEGVRVEAVYTPPTRTPADDIARVADYVASQHNAACTVTVPAGLRCDKPLVLEYTLDSDNPALIDALCIRAEPGSRADVVLVYRSTGDKPCFHGGFAAVEAGAGACVTLTKVQLLGPRDVQLDANAVWVDGDGSADVILCEMGGSQIVGSCDITLRETGGRGTLYALYTATADDRLDLSYRLRLEGRQTEGEIVARGALAGRAHKSFKSTLDFVRGASGAKAREEESVLTLSGDAQNLSAPLLLCGEDDVEGEHATSSGRPDPGKLYYLMSRGFSEQEARRQLVLASFDGVLRRIDAAPLREQILSRALEVVYDGD